MILHDIVINNGDLMAKKSKRFNVDLTGSMEYVHGILTWNITSP